MADEINMKAVLDLSDFNKGVSAINSAIAGLGALIKEVGIGSARYVGELAVRALLQAGRAAYNFAKDVAAAAFENHALHDTLSQVYQSLVDITRQSFSPLLDQINSLAQKAAPAFLGMVQRASEYLGRLAGDAFGYGQGLVSSFADGMWNAFSAITDALTGLGNLISGWLQPGSPPRLLPNIDKWGTAAMNEFLGGFKKADYSIFNQISSALSNLIRSLPMPKGGGVDMISRILGTREGIAKAVDELRTAGAVSTETMNSIIAQVGTADDEVRSYLQSVIALQAANHDVADAQKALNDATAAYHKLLEPIDRQLSGINEQQEQLTEDAEKGRLALILQDRNTTAAEKRQAQLRLQQIDAERARRAAVATGEAAVDAAQQQLDSAQAAQVAAQEVYDREAARIAVLTEQNQLLSEQARLLDSLADKVAAAAGGGKGGAGGGKKFAIDTSWIDDLLTKINEKLEPLKTAWTTAWNLLLEKTKPVRDFIDQKVIPLLGKLWTIISEAGGRSIQIISEWWNGTMVPMFKDFWTWSEAHILPHFRSLWNWIEAKLPSAVQTLVDKWNNVLLPALLSFTTWWTGTAIHNWEEIWEWLEVKIPAAINTTVAKINEITTALAIAAQGWQNFWSWVAGGPAQMPQVPGQPYGPPAPPTFPIPGTTLPGTYIPPAPTYGPAPPPGNNVTNNWYYSPTYQGTPPAPQLDFSAMRVWAE